MTAKPDQLALDFAQLQAEESKADLVLSFSPDAGVLVCGATRQWKDEIKRLLFRGRTFRFSRNLPEDCAWYAPNTRGVVVDRAALEQAAAALRQAGATVEVRFSTKQVPFSEREKARAERAGQRLERREGRATRLAAKADREFAQARSIAERIPMGQPILVGHHSEKRHRRDVAKIEKKGSQAVATWREAEQAKSRAAGAASREAARTDPGTMHRRIERLETKLRELQRNLFGHPGKGTTLARAPATGEYREKLEAMMAELRAEVAYWRSQLNEQVSDLGVRVWKPSDFRPGDAVEDRHGWAVVQRISPKSLTINYVQRSLQPLNPQKLTYERVEKKASEAEQQMLDAIGKLGRPSVAQLESELGWSNAAVIGIGNRLVKAWLVSAHRDPLAGGHMVFTREGWDAPAARGKAALKWEKSAKGIRSAGRLRGPDGLAHILVIERDRSDAPWRLSLRLWNEPMRIVQPLGPSYGFGKQLKAKEFAEGLVSDGTYPLL